jgi:hypothetical protein
MNYYSILPPIEYRDESCGENRQKYLIDDGDAKEQRNNALLGAIRVRQKYILN